MVIWTDTINLSEDDIARLPSSVCKRFQHLVCKGFLESFFGHAALQEFDCVEFYAGRANLTRMMRLSGYRAAKLDYLYGGQVGSSRKPHNTNPMDLLSVSGFALLALNIYIYIHFNLHSHISMANEHTSSLKQLYVNKFRSIGGNKTEQKRLYPPLHMPNS